ncbi:MAG: AAA family ATPase [Planctomycetes bacterium]|nr:AAA family ATPase [Planctomycetota bacterium]
MEIPRLLLKELTIEGTGVAPATVDFAPGLNLIVGASDTGKTYIFEALDFMLGAKDALRNIPESNGYDRVVLSIDPVGHVPFTLHRATTGGAFEAMEYADGRDKEPTATKILGPDHSSDPDGSLSAYLLRAIGLEGRMVRSNQSGKRRSVSFRDYAHVTLVDEEKIIQKSSPLTTGNYTTATAEENFFAFLMSGQDDSQIVEAEKKKDRTARLNAELSTVEEILAERQAELSAMAKTDESGDQVSRLEQAIREASQAVVTTNEQIADTERQRSELFDEHVQLQSRLQFVDEQLKRFRLLDSYYQSDNDRLQAVIEASRVVHELPEGSCPLCNRVFADGEGLDGKAHNEFEAACVSEVEKIERLRVDLTAAIADSTAEQLELTARTGTIEGEMKSINGELQRLIAPTNRVQQFDLPLLIEKRTSLAKADTIRASIRSLELRRDNIKTALDEKPAKTSFDTRVTTSAAFEFCKVVEGILKEWKYPDLGTVSLDTEKGDLVIGGQDRANKGKGYRAVTYAAFAIGLMKYCRMKDIPHPGFVILDTPVNPFKGPKTNNPNELVTDDVKVAFFEYLANDTSGDQIIIMENVEPPVSVRNRVKYHNFSKNPSIGRYGFFPLRKS